MKKIKRLILESVFVETINLADSPVAIAAHGLECPNTVAVGTISIVSIQVSSGDPIEVEIESGNVVGWLGERVRKVVALLTKTACLVFRSTSIAIGASSLLGKLGMVSI